MALKNISLTKKLRSDAAASWKRMEKAKMPSKRLESAWRSWDSQLALWKKYKAGKGNFALYPSDSNHVKGIAVDSHDAQRAWIKKNGKRYGWYPVTNEPWHFDYYPAKDKVGVAAKRLTEVNAALGVLRWRASLAKRKAGQRVLAKYGYYDGKIDGIVGPKTKAGYAKLQKEAK